jgi:very-short-patch-repair endonuclease
MSHLEDKLYGDIVITPELPLPERQYKFHPTRKWPFDFAWPDRRLAVEVDGGTWSGGRHTRGQGYENDCEKLNEAAILGWTVLRVTGKMVEDGRALTYIERMFDE